MARPVFELDRLCQAMQRSRLMLKRCRAERREAVRQFVGKHWSEEGTQLEVPLNLLSLYVQVIGRALVAQEPRFLLSTFLRSQKPLVSVMQSWVNQEVGRMRLAETLQRVVLDALFSIGICKVSLAKPDESAAVAFTQDAGQPFCERVDLDDFVFDLHARSFEEVSFIGHRYRVPLEVARESQIYDKKVRKQLQPTTDTLFNQEGDERIGVLGRGTYGADGEEFEDHIDLWEVYLPRHRRVLTLADDQVTGGSGELSGGLGRALREAAWIGPDGGPYHVLAYGVVPGNAMPKAPIQDLLDLHEAINRTLRKILRTADRMKEVGMVDGGASEDGSRVVKAEDGEFIKVNRPESVKVTAICGAQLQPLLGLLLTLKQLFDLIAGNLELLGGRSPQSRTLGQDRLLEDNASAGVSDMQSRTTGWVSRVGKALCWYWWKDPFRVMRTRHHLPGLPEFDLPRVLGPAGRAQVPFADLDIRCDPYSLSHKSPAERMQMLQQMMQGVVLPLMPLLQGQGITIDLNAYLEKWGTWMDEPSIGEIVTITEPVQQTDQGAPQAGPKETTITRQNVPMRTQRGDEQMLANHLLGNNPGGNPQANGVPS